MSLLPQGSTIGIIGGGQLGRMLAMAAAQLGHKTHIFCPDPNPPAAQVANMWTQAGYENTPALEEFTDTVDVATYEFENLPLSSLQHVAEHTQLFPNTSAIEIAQDRLFEKEFLNKHHIPTAPYANVMDRDDLDQAVRTLGLPAVLKTRRFGYDGKGQVMIRAVGDIDLAWEALKTAPGGLILEALIPFEREVSVVLARSTSGEIRTYGPIWNVHENHILAVSRVPAGITDETAKLAIERAEKLAHALDYIGVLTVEYFVLPDGSVLANEMAPRVHNSGHWTIEGAPTSQFENHIRAISGWPLGASEARGIIEMHNLIGRDVEKLPELAKDPHAHIHHYGKSAVRLGRKMGHVTWVR